MRSLVLLLLVLWSWGELLIQLLGSRVLTHSFTCPSAPASHLKAAAEVTGAGVPQHSLSPRTAQSPGTTPILCSVSIPEEIALNPSDFLAYPSLPGWKAVCLSISCLSKAMARSELCILSERLVLAYVFTLLTVANNFNINLHFQGDN